MWPKYAVLHILELSTLPKMLDNSETEGVRAFCPRVEPPFILSEESFKLCFKSLACTVKEIWHICIKRIYAHNYIVKMIWKMSRSLSHVEWLCRSSYEIGSFYLMPFSHIKLCKKVVPILLPWQGPGAQSPSVPFVPDPLKRLFSQPEVCTEAFNRKSPDAYNRFSARVVIYENEKANFWCFVKSKTPPNFVLRIFWAYSEVSNCSSS